MLIWGVCHCINLATWWVPCIYHLPSFGPLVSVVLFCVWSPVGAALATKLDIIYFSKFPTYQGSWIRFCWLHRFFSNNRPDLTKYRGTCGIKKTQTETKWPTFCRRLFQMHFLHQIVTFWFKFHWNVPNDPIINKIWLVRIMLAAWSAPSHYLNQWWASLLTHRSRRQSA